MGLTEIEIVCVGGITAYAEDLDEIVKLTWRMIERHQRRHDRSKRTHLCMSPMTVTGTETCTALDSLMSTSFVFSHISRRRASC